MKRVTLTPALSRRIVKDVREGIPAQVAARKQGVALETFLNWMSRRGRKYQAFAQAIDQAVAVAQAEHVLLLKRAAKRGKLKAAAIWLQSQAPSHFPPRAPVNIGQQNNLLALIKQVKDNEGKLQDPRVVLDAAEEAAEQAALPPAPPENASPDERVVFEVNGFTASRPDVLDMTPVVQ